MRKNLVLSVLTVVMAAWSVNILSAPEVAPDRAEGEGPYGRLILRGLTVINGEGAPPLGPVDIVIEGDRIASVTNVGYPGVPIEDRRRPKAEKGDWAAVALPIGGVVLLVLLLILSVR